MKITLDPKRLAAAIAASAATSHSSNRSARRLPGEPRPFRERPTDRSTIRNLVPQQTLQEGQITSGRSHEVTRGTDALLRRIDQLEHQLATSKARRLMLARERNTLRQELRNGQT